MAGPILNKNARRRALKKAKKQQEHDGPGTPVASDPKIDESKTQQPSKNTNQNVKEEDDDDFVDSYNQDFMDVDNPLFEQYRGILNQFQDPGEVKQEHVYYEDEDDMIPDEDAEEREMKDEDDEDDEEGPTISKKKRKQQNKLSIAELKALVRKPELVDWWDTSSKDPRLLLSIKGSRNVVPIPEHWALKREYLSNKRGIEKPPFVLPKFIADTGITEMRDAALEKQEQASLKQKQRERVAPKMGRLDVDYQKLYEAFFRFQSKPDMTRYGEVYYEGKEYETNLRHLRPGELSDELKEALSMPPGAPPPWLINQQRFGPPPSYPGLKIPGLNAPPPVGGQWGFHPGGWGKPPVDEFNRPLYGGDIYGVLQPQQNQQLLGEPVEKSLWGQLEDPEESEEEEESEDEDEGMTSGDDEKAGVKSEAVKSEAGTTSVAPSTYGGTESEFTLRKQKRGGTETEEAMHPRSAGQVIPERSARAEGFFGSDRAYDLKNTGMNVLGEEDRSKKRRTGDVDVSVDLDTLEREDRLSKDEISKRYDAQRQAAADPWGGGQLDHEDLSQLIAEESGKRNTRDDDRRRKRR